MIQWIRTLWERLADLLGIGGPLPSPTPAYAAAGSQAPPSSPRSSPGVPAGISAPRKMVHNRDRARGLDYRLIQFLDWWDANGWFPITIPDGGGMRTRAQVEAYAAAGTSNAATLEDTPHGRGGAVDVYPARLSASGRTVIGIYLAEQRTTDPVPEAWVRPDLFEALGAAAEDLGLEWGGRWRNLYGFGPMGDAPHVQVPNWRALPFPPPTAVS